MLKTFFKVVTTLTLLVGAYFGYVHAFAIVVEQLKAIKRTDNVVFVPHDSKSKLESIKHAREVFGDKHWTARDDLAYRYYNAERGYWIYAREFERIDEENGVRYGGKRIRLKPFALISKSRDGKNTKTITSDVAVFDLNEPLSFNPNPEAEPLKIKHAHLEPNVCIRDDKGTPHDLADDMNIGPLTTADYDEGTQQISTLSPVVIVDQEMVTTSEGMLIQLRKNDPSHPGGASSGFQGAERLDLLKNPHVVIRDVGKSGFMPGTPKPRGATTKKSKLKDEGGRMKVANGADQETSEPEQPTPLDLRCDSKMQIYLPKPRLLVSVGPPAPPAPTMVQFERNVVVLRGPIDEWPDQLTCDTLKLSLIPAEKTPVETAQPPAGASDGSTREAQVGGDPKQAARPDPVAQTAARAGEPVVPDGYKQAGADGSQPKSEPKPDGESNDGLLGGLTLQRAHATGHAVWLLLPAQGVKLRCNELIHLRQAAYAHEPDLTYFRGDRTRPLELEKLSLVEEEGPDQGKISSVTNIWTVDATMLDNGAGMDSADVVAHGPGRLETRPDRGQPVERVAIWQDKLILQNELDAQGQVVRKLVDLSGNRPCFIDKLQDTRIDSGFLIKVALTPKKAALPAKAKDDPSAAIFGGKPTARTLNNGTGAMAANAGLATSTAANTGAGAPRDGGSADLAGGNLQIERLRAFRDVHLIAPAKTMTARDRLDAEFVQPESPQVAANVTSKPAESATVAVTAPTTVAAASPDIAPAPGEPKVAEQDQPQVVMEERKEEAQKEPEEPEPPMTGSCDRMWALVALKPKTASDQTSAKEGATTRKSASGRPGSGETNAEIRKVWMWGNVALHKDPAKGETKGEEASGEAIYLNNRSTNNALTYIYQRDPTEKRYLPGPLPPARVENAEINITAAGRIGMDQRTDEAWVEGPGVLTQLTNRGFLTDKSGDPDLPEPGSEVNDGQVTRTGLSDPPVTIRTTAFVNADDVQENAPAPKEKPAAAKPKTRAGKPLNNKVPMTIGFSERMNFAGRSVDPEGRRVARIDFYGIVDAQMEDARLYAEEKMIVFTDKEVPLAQLGEMSKSKKKRGAAGAQPQVEDQEGEAKSSAELALIFCYRNPLAISRKVDPDFPRALEKQWLEGVDMLAYDRRTGEFYVPGEGTVYLYELSGKPPPTSDSDAGEDNKGDSHPQVTETQRTVTPASDRTAKPGTGKAATKATTGTRTAPKNTGARTDDRPASNLATAYDLTQVHFKKGMRGRYGTGKETDTLETRWAEFYVDIESARAKVPNTSKKLDFDRLPADGMFLTGQTLRVISEPPPPLSPKATPARTFMKAWERAYASSHDKILQGDVITYDSYKDLIYAYGENGRNVIFAEQYAPGQPISPGASSVVQLNPKTGTIHLVNSDTLRLLDKKTGTRPIKDREIDPNPVKPKKPKRSFKLPTQNQERKGFTGT